MLYEWLENVLASTHHESTNLLFFMKDIANHFSKVAKQTHLVGLNFHSCLRVSVVK